MFFLIKKREKTYVGILFNRHLITLSFVLNYRMLVSHYSLTSNILLRNVDTRNYET